MNELTAFNFEGKQEVRTFERNGDPWFVAKDVCDILGLENPTETLRNFPENEKANLSSTEVRDREIPNRGVNIVNEPGLYRLIFQSRKPEAEAFKTWVFTDVLPSIRKEGYYRLKADYEKVLALRSLPVLESPQGGEYRYKFFELHSVPQILDWLGRSVAEGLLTRTEMLSIISSTSEKEACKNARELFIKAFINEHIILTNHVGDYLVIEEAYNRYRKTTADPVSRHVFTRKIRKHFEYSILEWVKRVNGKPIRVFVSCKLK